MVEAVKAAEVEAILVQAALEEPVAFVAPAALVVGQQGLQEVKVVAM